MSRSPSRPGRRLAVLVAGAGALLVIGITQAPVAGAGANPAARAWRIEPSPDPTGATGAGLDAVSCSGPGSCVAVGSADYPSGHQLPRQLPLIERLSNGRWTIARSPALRGATASLLRGVSCPRADFCVAVGYVRYASPAAFDALAETWNGTSWTIDPLPAPAGAQEPELAAVSCPARGACVAAGDYIDAKTDTYRPLADRLAGHAWSLLAAPAPHGASGDSEFTGIDCATPAACEVVGNVNYNDTFQDVFAYGLSGSAWTAQHQVNPGPPPGNFDNGVSCSSAGACTSVGTVWIVQESALAEYWNGSTWVRQTTPAPPGRPETTLLGVSCGGATSCVTVGGSARVNQKNGHLGPYHAMAEVWNGTAWSQSPPLGSSGTTVSLTAISCPSPRACVAAGGSSTASGEKTLIEAYQVSA